MVDSKQIKKGIEGWILKKRSTQERFETSKSDKDVLEIEIRQLEAVVTFIELHEEEEAAKATR